jgi:hypothetical protein
MLTSVGRQRKRQGFWMDRYRALSGLLCSQIFARTQLLRTSPNLITIGRLFKTKARTHMCAQARGGFTHMPPSFHGLGETGKQFASRTNYWPPIEVYSSTWFRMKIISWRLDSGTGKEYERCPPPPQYNSDQHSNFQGPVTLSWLRSGHQKWSKIMCSVIPHLFLEFRPFI